jgi:hypothetical protein
MALGLLLGNKSFSFGKVLLKYGTVGLSNALLKVPLLIGMHLFAQYYQ